MKKVVMVREEGKLELGEGRTKGNRNKRQTMLCHMQRTEIHSNDSTRAIHGEEQVDDTHMHICILVIYLNLVLFYNTLSESDE